MATTLADLINRLPRALAARYNKGTFWQQAANDVLLQIELRCNLPRVKWEYCLPIVDKKVSYKIPPQVRKVLGIYAPTADSPLVDYRRGVAWIQRGDYIELREEGLVAADPILQTVAISAGEDTVSFAETTESLENMCVVLGTDVDGINGQIVARQSTESGETEIMTKRPWLTQPETDDEVTFHSSFLVVEYIRGFTRITDPVAEIVDDDEDLLFVVREGMRYLGHLNVDESNEMTPIAFKQYQKALDAYVANANSGLFQQKPSFRMNLPRRFGTGVISGNVSGIYGDREQQG